MAPYDSERLSFEWWVLRCVVTLLLVLKSLERGSRWCFRTSKPRRQVLLPFLLLFIFVDSWKKHEYSLGKKRGPNYLAKLSTLVKNLRKSRIQHYERSKLRFLLEWIKVDQKCQKWSILASFWKSKACGQTVLPDRSLLIWQKIGEHVKIEKLYCDILGDFQTLCIV